MKKLIILMLLLGHFSNAQMESHFGENGCAMIDQTLSSKGVKSSVNCSNTSNYWSDENAYLPNELNNVIYVRLNVIFPTKIDGTGNFEENNAEHNAFLNDVYNSLNYRMSHLVNLPSGSGANCITTLPENFISDIKIQYVINKIYIVHSGWDSLVSSYQWVNDPYNPLAEHDSLENHLESDGNATSSTLYPPHNNYYYTTLSNQILNDPNIPKGINIFYPNIGYLYNDLVRDQNHNNYLFTDSQGHTDSYIDLLGWSASQFPTKYDLNRFTNMTMNDLFLNYYFFKNILPSNDHFSQYNYEDDFRGWLISVQSRALMHEIGHAYNLSHSECQGTCVIGGDNHPNCNCCDESVMNQSGSKPRNYLIPNDISEMYQALSLTNMRNFVTENSYTGTSITVSSNETWDIDWRIYSDVLVKSGNELRITCKTIMPSQAQIIVQDGASLILDGGIIESADGQNWEGIQLEGSGFFEILQETPEIENEYFYAYIESLRISEDTAFNEVKKLELTNNSDIENKLELKVYPNPSNESITIIATDNFLGFEIYDIDTKKIILINNYHQGKSSSIDISNFKNGVYLIKVLTENKTLYSKFIKNK